MEFITFKKDAKGRFLFSQQMVDFVARGGFRSGWVFSQPISQLQNEGGGLQNGTRVPRGGFAAAKHPAKFSQLISLNFAQLS